MKTNQLLAEVKASGQDFEWYPTTDQIINAIKHDIEENVRYENPSMLDCGAGDGRVLEALTEGAKYAIEKSEPLLNALARDIYIVGTEFKEQTLIDKKVDIVFSNPPYLEFEEWALRIINEANAGIAYLVIPERWQSSDMLKNALEARSAEATVILSTDFLNAERAARAKVSVVRIDLSHRTKESYRSRHSTSSPNVDPFDKWFADNFKIEIANINDEKYDLGGTTKKKLDEGLSNELVSGTDLITALERLYQRDLDRLICNYQSLSEIDPVLLKELGVELRGIQEALRLKIKGLKDLYWQELFSNLRKVTDKLTSHSREKMLRKLTSHTHVDFTSNNAYAVVIWVIKNSNHYFDDQLIDMVETMTEKANVRSYVSNSKTFGEEGWRYNRPTEALTNYKLDYRIVLERVGGICDPNSWYSSRTKSGLVENAEKFIDNLRTVATNIGFDTTRYDGSRNFSWSSGKKHNFHYFDYQTGEAEILFEAKAFKNGNIHMKLNQKFLCKLNVEFGRLKGWIKSPKEAAEELDIPFEQAAESFEANLKLEGSNILRLDFKEVAK